MAYKSLRTTTRFLKPLHDSNRMARIQAALEESAVFTEVSAAAQELAEKGSFGAVLDDGRVQLSLFEAVYLAELKKVDVLDRRNARIPLLALKKKAARLEPAFAVRYAVFKDLRENGYVVKTALKFGADFRVYDRGTRPGGDHARWITYAVRERDTLTWHEFSAKNRVAHSTKKRLLIAVVDDEGDVSYWEARWMRP
jgi:tRNA-intron endonuclease